MTVAQRAFSTFLLFIIRRHPTSPLFPYTTLFRSDQRARGCAGGIVRAIDTVTREDLSGVRQVFRSCRARTGGSDERSEEHTSELQSRVDLVCRLLLEKKKKEERDAQV